MSVSGSIISSLVGRLSTSRDRKKQGVNDVLTGEQEEEIVDIFKLFDSDRDGLVSKSELKEALWSLGQHPGEEDIDAMFYEYDFNRSQALDCSEFRRLIVAKLSYKNTREEFTAAFRAIDTKKEGRLDIGELQRLMAATGCALTDQELKEIFGELDEDGNGKVDFYEFVDHMMSA